MAFKVGEDYRCPKCGSGRAKIVWMSEDGKTTAVQCPSARSYMHEKGIVMLIGVDELT